ncbi:uncharacterized protein LOC128236473 [Mya arenaria]|uniref:uncharacterized protein LOC128236473 n=1 Tax=Mya arenaria TaxID=6604 RepID=UPI0022E64E6A|nr:uncharacterized protein LOC128236473 [Mya arenaria]XP_052807309.1 uncharacterized protein LOC128236473 [Mya arenaria]
MSDAYTFDDADRFNNILQMLMRCCVKVMKKILPIIVTSLGYTSVDQFLSTEKPHVLKMPLASLQKNQDILYPPTRILTNIEQWDMSLLTCVFTHIQRKLITKEIGNPTDPFINLYKAQVLATTVGQEHEEKLYPQSGKPTNLNKWNMSVCACIFSVVCPKPNTLHVKIAESLNSLREMRNSLCHTESPEMEPLVYEEHITVLKDFVNSGLTYIGDVAFETEIKKDMDDIENGKMRRYIVADHKHLQESYANDRDTSQRLDGIEKELRKLSCQLQKDPVQLTLMLFFAKLTDDHKNLLYSSFVETFTQLVEENAPEIVGEINPELKDFFTHSVFQTWKIFNNPFEGRRVVGAKRECLKIKLHFDDAVRMWKFIKIYISGTLDSLIEPIQTFLRTKEGFENLEMTVVLPDVFAALNQSGDSKEIDSNSMMCVLELLNQRLVPLEQNQQDDTVRKSLEMKRTSSQQYITNAGVQTGEMESEGPEETFVEIKERLVVEESKTPLVELHLDESGQTIMPLTSEDTETPIKGYTIENTGEKVMTTISKEPVKLVEELTVDESGQKVKTPMPKKSD